MRATLLAIFALAVIGLRFAPILSAGDQHLYLSAGGEVTVFGIDAETGELEKVQAIDLDGAGPMGVSPDRTRLYVNSVLAKDGTTGKRPAIAAFAIGDDGRLEPLEHAASVMSAGYFGVDATGRFLAGNNYGDGTAALWRLDGEGVYRGGDPQIVTLEQRAHSAVFSPDNRWLLVPATGPNKVFQLRFDSADGSVTPNDPPHADGPQGEDEARQPRHLVFHPTLPMAYTTNERERPGVGVWRWDAEKGQLETVQNLVTYPEGFDGVITTADLHFTPDGEFLYVSNRDITDRQARFGQSAIVGFRCDPQTGRLAPVSYTPCEHVPRSFDVDDSGHFVYVAGQGDDTLGAYRIDPDTGELTRIARYEVGERPSWVTCVTR